MEYKYTQTHTCAFLEKTNQETIVIINMHIWYYAVYSTQNAGF